MKIMISLISQRVVRPNFTGEGSVPSPDRRQTVDFEQRKVLATSAAVKNFSCEDIM